MAKRLALVHTVTGVLPAFAALCRELLPGVSVYNLVDESLIQDTLQAGQVTPLVVRRLASHLVTAEEAGADLVVVTCTSIGPAIDLARPLLRVPLMRIDEPMADQAVQVGRRVGLLGTARTTVGPSTALIQARAAAAGKTVEVIPALCEEAPAAMAAGDPQRFDALLRAAIDRLAPQVDVIVLAQASMARVADTLGEKERRVPVLTSLRSGIERAAQLLR